MAFVKSMLADKTIPPNVMYILQSIAKKQREIPPDQMAFVQDIINGAKLARQKSRIGDLRAALELEEATRNKMNEHIAESLPPGEVAELFKDMAGGDMDDEMKALNE